MVTPHPFELLDGTPPARPFELSNTSVTTRKRVQSQSDISLSDDGDGESRSKKKLDHSLPALSLRTAAQAVPTGNEQVAKVLELKRNYLIHVSGVKSYIACGVNALNVPSSVCTNIIEYAYVDLVQIFASIYATCSEPPDIHKFGEFELFGGTLKAAKQIRQHGDWTLAWERYKQAVTFLYPFPATELAKYEDYISNLFASVRSDSRHIYALNFDKAIRAFVSGSNSRHLRLHRV